MRQHYDLHTIASVSQSSKPPKLNAVKCVHLLQMCMLRAREKTAAKRREYPDWVMFLLVKLTKCSICHQSNNNKKKKLVLVGGRVEVKLLRIYFDDTVNPSSIKEEKFFIYFSLDDASCGQSCTEWLLYSTFLILTKWCPMCVLLTKTV